MSKVNKRKYGFKNSEELRSCHAKTRKLVERRIEEGRRCLEELHSLERDNSSPNRTDGSNDYDADPLLNGTTSEKMEEISDVEASSVREPSPHVNRSRNDGQPCDSERECIEFWQPRNDQGNAENSEDVRSPQEIPQESRRDGNGCLDELELTFENEVTQSQGEVSNDGGVSELDKSGKMNECNLERSIGDDFVKESTEYVPKNDAPESGDLGESLPNSKHHSKKFENLLKLVLFPDSNSTLEDVLNMTQSIYLRYKIPKAVRIAILEMIKVLAGPDFKNLQMSDYYVSLYNKPSQDNRIYTFFCTECYQSISGPLLKNQIKSDSIGVCAKCSAEYKLTTKNSNFYINMNVEYQFRCILQNPIIFEAILDSVSKMKESRNSQSVQSKKTAICDVQDGEIYEQNDFYKEAEEEKIVLDTSVNSDGASMYETTKYALWTILMILNALPPKLRFKFTVLFAALYTCKEPNFHLMNSFMDSFLSQMHTLMHEGMLFYYKARKKTYRIFVVPLFFVVDTVARPILAARKQYNAFYGCSWCYIKGEKIGSMRYLKKDNAPNRTQEEYLRDLSKREKVRPDRNGEKVYRGVRGKSKIAELLPYFDNIWGYPPDYMHGVLLGVTKQFWEFLSKSSCQFKLSPKAREKIDERLISMRPIKAMYRTPSQLKKRGSWKAADWLYWLIFYSLPCFRQILDDRVYRSYALFVDSIRCLMAAKIDDETLKKCERNLRQFVEDCEEFFGPEFMTFNVHSLLHLVDSVRKSGPLWATSAFPFESGIGDLKEFVTGPTNVLEQITSHVLELNEFQCRILSDESESRSLEFCKKTMTSDHSIINCHRTEENAIVPFCKVDLEKNEYNRCIYENVPFHSTSYKRPEKIDDTYIQLTNGDFAQILHFSIKDNACYAKVREVHVCPVEVAGTVINHVLLVSDEISKCKVIPITKFQKKMIHLKVKNDLEYLCHPLEVFHVR